MGILIGRTAAPLIGEADHFFSPTSRPLRSRRHPQAISLTNKFHRRPDSLQTGLVISTNTDDSKVRGTYQNLSDISQMLL